MEIKDKRLLWLSRTSWDNLTQPDREELRALHPSAYSLTYYDKYNSYPYGTIPNLQAMESLKPLDDEYARDKELQREIKTMGGSAGQLSVTNNYLLPTTQLADDWALRVPGGVHFANMTLKQQYLSGQAVTPATGVKITSLAGDGKSADWVVPPEEISTEDIVLGATLFKSWKELESEGQLPRMKVNSPTCYAFKFKEQFGKYPVGVKVDAKLVDKYLKEYEAERVRVLNQKDWNELAKENSLEELKKLDLVVFKRKFRERFGKEYGK
jgi:hypothetical protein